MNTLLVFLILASLQHEKVEVRNMTSDRCTITTESGLVMIFPAEGTGFWRGTGAGDFSGSVTFNTGSSLTDTQTFNFNAIPSAARGGLELEVTSAGVRQLHGWRDILFFGFGFGFMSTVQFFLWIIQRAKQAATGDGEGEKYWDDR